MNRQAYIEQIEQKELELRERWVVLKFKLTDWLEKTLEQIPLGVDHKGIKCIVDSINQLEKLVGANVKAPGKLIDQATAKDRTESILDRLQNRQ